MRRSVLAAIIALLALAPAARAQGGSSFAFLAPGRVLSDTQLSARVSGQVGVSFHADTGSGCAALAACGYAGTLAWRPGAGGTLEVIRYRQGGQVHAAGDLVLGQSDNGPGALAGASVQRSAGDRALGSCGDEQAGQSIVSGSERAGRLVFRLAGVLASGRCAGPLPGDLAGAGPSVSVPMATLLRGGARLDFRTQRSFAGHGFAGTLTSTVVVSLGRPRPVGGSGPSPSGATPPPERTVSVAVTLTGGGGRLTAAVSGSGNPDVCGPLDSCGLAGTLTIAPRLAVAHGYLTAAGPASRPDLDFLTALGLATGGRTQGIEVGGAVQGTDRGVLAASERQSASCSDTAPIGSYSVELAVTGRVLRVGYVPPVALPFFGGAALRTRCPGPTLVGPSPLASGTVPGVDVRRRTFTARLTAARAFGDQGYAVALSGALRLTLHIGRLSRQQSVTTIL